MESGIELIDIVIIGIYLIGIAILGSLSGGRQRTIRDYFLGGSNVPWLAVTFAIVAAETSTLTFISIPGLAYLTNLNFLQLTIGYLLARIFVSLVFLPAYQKGSLITAYGFLETRFGSEVRSFASIVFLFTRIAADGVRLFATAIPLAIIFRSFSAFDSYSNVQIYVVSIIIISIVTLLYTYTGGLKGIIWVDVVQMGIYIGGAVLSMFIILGQIGGGLQEVLSTAASSGKLQLFNFHFGKSIADFFKQPYTIVNSLIGGFFLSMATHGTDQLIVQRLLATRSLRDGQKALIGSGIVVMIQFALFLFIGVLLFVFFQSQGMEIGNSTAPFTKADEVFPYFIIHYLPTGVKGIIIAGLLAAAMSTLAGSMSSLSSSVISDLIKPLQGKRSDTNSELFLSRMMTVFWAVVLSLVAFLFIRVLRSVVEIALGIASITYGGLLGTFLLGLLFPSTSRQGALIGFAIGILTMILIIVVPFALGKPPIFHWTWYTLIGCLTTITTGTISSRFFHD